MRQDSKQSREIEPQILHFALDHPQERSKVNNTTSSPSAKNRYGFFEYFSKTLFLSFLLNYDETWGRYLNQFLIPKAGKIFMLFSGPKLEKPVQWPLLWPPINLFLPPACPPASHSYAPRNGKSVYIVWSVCVYGPLPPPSPIPSRPPGMEITSTKQKSPRLYYPIPSPPKANSSSCCCCMPMALREWYTLPL